MNMEVESVSASVPTATTSTTTTGVVVGSVVEPPKPKPFLEGTAHSQTHIMTVNIDISDDNHDDNDYSTKVNGGAGDGATVPSKNGSVSFEGVNSSSNKTVSSSSSSYNNNHHPHSPLLNGRNGGSSDIKRIQRTLVSEERLTAAWRKLSLLDLFYPSFIYVKN